jgi:hypothetical protein
MSAIFSIIKAFIPKAVSTKRIPPDELRSIDTKGFNPFHKAVINLATPITAHPKLIKRPLLSSFSDHMQVRNILLALAFIGIASMIPLSGHSDGAAIVLDKDALTVTPETPTHDMMLMVNATVLFVDATPEKVTLKYSMCTETYCGIDTSIEMTRVGSTDVWTATIGPFAKEDAKGDPFIDLKIHVFAQGKATDGLDDPEVDTDTKLIYFKDEPDDGGDGKDSPTGLDLAICALIGLTVALAIRSSRSRNL